jgi:hypothetical protein
MSLEFVKAPEGHVDQYHNKAKKLVLKHWTENRVAEDRLTANGVVPTVDDFYVVWFCKTLQNWKALVSTDLVGGVYYEVTHDGSKNRTYVDQYVKTSNTVYPDFL